MRCDMCPAEAIYFWDDGDGGLCEACVQELERRAQSTEYITLAELKARLALKEKAITEDPP